MIKNSIAKKSSGREGALLLFDGMCNLCNGFVNFLIDRDPDGHFVFGSLQSDAAKPYLDATGVDPDATDSMVLIENGEVYLRSTAFLQAVKRLPLPWSLLFGFIAIPKPIRDFFYQRVAAYRYDWFGKRNQCRAPTPELRKRFINKIDSTGRRRSGIGKMESSVSKKKGAGEDSSSILLVSEPS